MVAEPVAEPAHEQALVFEAQLPQGRLLTWEDLQSIPDDEHWRYQLIEGNLLVSPSPDLLHQMVVFRLAQALDAVRPPELLVVLAPFDFVPRAGYAVQPDVMVVDRTRVERQRAVEPPLLAVEVLSPSSRSTDRSLKRLVYEEFGVPSYWIVDPLAPSLTALDLVDGRYVEAGRVTGDEAYPATLPFPVTVTVAQLVADLP